MDSIISCCCVKVLKKKNIFLSLLFITLTFFNVPIAMSASIPDGTPKYTTTITLCSKYDTSLSGCDDTIQNFVKTAIDKRKEIGAYCPTASEAYNEKYQKTFKNFNGEGEFAACTKTDHTKVCTVRNYEYKSEVSGTAIGNGYWGWKKIDNTWTDSPLCAPFDYLDYQSNVKSKILKKVVCTCPDENNNGVCDDYEPAVDKPQCSDGIDNDGDGFIDFVSKTCDNSCKSKTISWTPKDGKQHVESLTAGCDGFVEMHFNEDEVAVVLEKTTGEKVLIGHCEQEIKEYAFTKNGFNFNSMGITNCGLAKKNHETVLCDRNGKRIMSQTGNGNCYKGTYDYPIEVKSGEKITMYFGTLLNTGIHANTTNSVVFKPASCTPTIADPDCDSPEDDNEFPEECEDEADNDKDGLIDKQDPGCISCTGAGCKENQTYTCTDTDNGNFVDIFGTTTYKKGKGLIATADYCVNSTTLAEQVCTNTPKFDSSKKTLEGYGRKTITCEFGCEAGKCKPECSTDSDCGDNQKCEDNKCVDKEECEDEADNDQDGLIDTQDLGCISCTGTGCKENQTYTCTDTDGGNFADIFGTTTYKKGKGLIATPDYCVNSTTLAEQVCTNTPKFDSSKKTLEGYGRKTITCEFGCANGKCKPECSTDSDCGDNQKCEDNKCVDKEECEDEADNDKDGLIDKQDPGCISCTGAGCKENQTYTCTDTDNGEFAAIFGTTTYKKGKGSIATPDYCVNSTTLAEQVCTNTPKFDSSKKTLEGYGRKTITCEFGCEAGKCKPECSTDTDCESGQKCIDNKCVDSTKTIIALLECVTNNQDGTYTAYFGYENPNDETINVPACSSDEEGNSVNLINGSTTYCEQTSDFKHGRVKGAFNVIFDGTETVAWKLKNNYEDAQVITASSSSTKCAAIEPYGQCIDRNNDGTYKAYFGYNNKNDFEISIPVGVNNMISPDPEDRGQPEAFVNGLVDNSFDADFTDSVTWIVDGNSSTVTKKTAPCVEPQCTETDITKAKASLHGDEFTAMNEEQSNLLLEEENPYPQIRDIEASVDRRLNRGDKINTIIKNQVAKLSDVMLTCENDDFCPLVDNEEILNLVERRLKKLRRMVGRTVRQRSIDSTTRQKLLNDNANILASKLTILNTIPRFANDCD